MHLGIRIVGYLLVALIVAGLCLQLFTALKSGQPFIGLNVRHQPIGTYSTIAAMVIVAAIGVYALVRRIRRRPK